MNNTQEIPHVPKKTELWSVSYEGRKNGAIFEQGMAKFIFRCDKNISIISNLKPKTYKQLMY